MKRSPGSISKSDPSTVPAVDLTGVLMHFHLVVFVVVSVSVLVVK